ncbi:hypothetical protein CLV28_0448 [Sediminihabitans luteus]|uniref:LPXTG-motif cell wall-anchored protein n=1 Tax=Sediminihabitans luteus TaxID=1138585 RepID=A0A2M9CZ71_9CELL|nr:hypothetical protein [Sediminihabitans luteus]PJJ77234.1 hypothetical protein CLV28_0448 [Sediminihabitans luteus]GII98682.1 hypothetical protein Slu03_10600 [Sediminihabitans luteus]
MRTRRPALLTALAVALTLTSSATAATAVGPAATGHAATGHTATTRAGDAPASDAPAYAVSSPGGTIHRAHRDATSHEVAVYLYKKDDTARPASWENSLEQVLLTTTERSTWLDELPAGLLPATAIVDDVVTPVCGDGWALQQDAADVEVTWPETVEYPFITFGWAADKIVDAKHTDLVGLPACGSTTPAVPVVTVTPPTCDAPESTVAVEPRSADVRLETVVDGEAVRIRMEDVPADGFGLESALAAHGITPAYGTLALRAVYYDRTAKRDVPLGTLDVTVQDPASLECATAPAPTPVALATPALVDQCGTDLDGLAPLATEGVEYALDTTDGGWTVIATATPGHVIEAAEGWTAVGDGTYAFDLGTGPTDEACDEGTTDDGTTGTTDTTDVDTTDVGGSGEDATDAPSDAVPSAEVLGTSVPSPGEVLDASDDLASTGSDALLWGGIALALVAAGGLTVVVVRRRRA